MKDYIRIFKKELKKISMIDYFVLRKNWKKYNNLMKISDTEFAYRHYRKITGKELNLNEPKSFNEKLWYLKLNYRNPLMTKCSDKYKVREYVKECGLEHILNEVYKVYDSAKEINFNNLPSDQVFFKCNHTSGYNAIYKEGHVFNKRHFVRKFDFILRQNYYHVSREWNYKNIEPKIICERVLDTEGLLDYRFLCFEGKVKLLFIDSETCADDGTHYENAKRNVYDRDMNFLDFTIGRDNFPLELAAKPENFEIMREYAEILSKPFPFVRVDFYNINGKIYFGELTFYHGGGTQKISSEEWDYRLGSWINLNDVKEMIRS